jgi:hypothetical protein
MDTKATTGVFTPGRPKGRIKKLLLRGAAVLVAAAVVAHVAWKYSGAQRWTKVGERGGVTVYSMKSPGSTIEKFKAVWKIHSRLSRVVMWVSDTDQGPQEHAMGLYDLKILDRRGDRMSWSSYKQPIVSFLTPREFVIKTEFEQDPKTKALVYSVTAEPGRIPPNDCCVRISVMDNRWTLTPLTNGDIEVEWFVDMDLGGAVPYLLQNMVMPEGMLTFAPKLQGFMENEKYKNAKYDWIQEMEP